MKDETEFLLERKCADCGNIDTFRLTKREAAFSLYNFSEKWNFTCSRCGSKSCASLGGYYVELNKALLLEWAFDNSLSVDQQDEEIILAEAKYLDVLLDLLDNHKILPKKRKIIIAALSVMLYDNTLQEDIEDVNEELAEIVKAQLVKRRQDVIDSQDWIGGYVKEVVFPLIGLTLD